MISHQLATRKSNLIYVALKELRYFLELSCYNFNGEKQKSGDKEGHLSIKFIFMEGTP